jgi:hypothetical protein
MSQIVVLSLILLCAGHHVSSLKTMRYVKRSTAIQGWTAHDGLLVDEGYKDKKVLTSEPWEEIYERDRIDGFRADYMKVDGKITDIGHAGIYGEILPMGIRRLYSKLDIQADDVVYDLGSGTGKVVLQFAIETTAGKCHGIELGETRYRGSMQALETLKESPTQAYRQAAAKCVFTKGDILADEPSWETEASVLFICATAFPSTLMENLLGKIASCSSQLRAVLLYTGCTNGGDPQLLDTETSKWHFSELLCESSWDPENTVHLYERR